MTSGPPASAGRLAQRLDHLLRTVLHDDSDGPRPYRYTEVADAINEAAARTVISANYLAYLRQGRRGSTGRTSRDKIWAIADFFGVPRDYFDHDDVSAIDAQLDIAATLRDAGIRCLVAQCDGLPPPILDALGQMAAQARRIAGLPRVPIDPAPHAGRSPTQAIPAQHETGAG